MTLRVPSGSFRNISRPILTMKGTTPAGVAADLVTTTIIYNPVTYGYVLATELKLPNRIEIISAYLTEEGYVKSEGPVFSFPVNVHQPRVVFDEFKKMFVFVSQLEKSHQLSAKNILLQKSLNASGYPNNPPQAVAFGSTAADESSISLHFDNATRCVRVCFLHVNDNTLTEPTCTKLCASGDNQYNVRPLDVSFCTCRNTAINPHVIEYPVNSAVFGVWEEKDSTRHRLHGYFVSTTHFQQNPPATVQEHPQAVYKSSDGQVCVTWRYQSSANTCSNLGIRCFESTTRCNDLCCCQQRNSPHCGACGAFLECDANALCTSENQCECRADLGFEGDGTTCSFDPCVDENHNCTDYEDCKPSGNSFTCVCKRGYKRENNTCVQSDPCAPGLHDCHKKAICQRGPAGTYACKCFPNFVGNGKVCVDTNVCHKHATFINNKCVCNRGYVGNGAFCCPTKFKDKLVVLGNSISLNLDTKCIGPFLPFTAFQWFHGNSSTPVGANKNSKYMLRPGNTSLVITAIRTKHLGEYTVRIVVASISYELSARIDRKQVTARCGCGHSGKINARISVGRNETKPGEFPWQVMLCGNDGVFCGGVMISKCCILTLAHCVTGSGAQHAFKNKTKALQVCLGRRCGDCNTGVYPKKAEQREEKLQCFKVHRIHVHQDYNQETFEHDIALLQLKSPKCIKCRDESAKPICLPVLSRDSRYIADGKKAWVIGWGEIRAGQGVASCLRKTTTTLVPRSQCRAHYARQHRPAIVTKGMMCAEEDMISCQLYSGAPLMVKNRDFRNRYVLAGLVSWGSGKANSFGVYTEITRYLDWIYATCSDWN